MTIDQLRLLIEEAAREVLVRHGRPAPVTVVLPLEGSTKVLSLEAFPDEDADRKAALSVLAAKQMVPANAACFGFLAEAEDPDGQELLLAIYGARRRGAFVMAATVAEDGSLSEFTEAEPLEPTALPFIQPLQHAADMSEAPDDPSAGGLPIIQG